MTADNVGASAILLGAAAVIAVVVRFGAAGDEAGDNNQCRMCTRSGRTSFPVVDATDRA